VPGLVVGGADEPPVLQHGYAATPSRSHDVRGPDPRRSRALAATARKRGRLHGALDDFPGHLGTPAVGALRDDAPVGSSRADPDLVQAAFAAAHGGQTGPGQRSRKSARAGGAPTGSGKTLAASLVAGPDPTEPRPAEEAQAGCRVLYVFPAESARGRRRAATCAHRWPANPAHRGTARYRDPGDHRGVRSVTRSRRRRLQPTSPPDILIPPRTPVPSDEVPSGSIGR